VTLSHHNDTTGAHSTLHAGSRTFGSDTAVRSAISLGTSGGPRLLATLGSSPPRLPSLTSRSVSATKPALFTPVRRIGVLGSSYPECCITEVQTVPITPCDTSPRRTAACTLLHEWMNIRDVGWSTLCGHNSLDCRGVVRGGRVVFDRRGPLSGSARSSGLRFRPAVASACRGVPTPRSPFSSFFSNFSYNPHERYPAS
jgi:hypothetical protein